MSLVAQCPRGSGQVARSQSRIRLEARENKSGELHAAHIATVHASTGPRTPPGKQREERRAEWKTQLLPVKVRVKVRGLAAGHQGPGWRYAARVQGNQAQVKGAPPAAGWGAQPAPRHPAYLSDMSGGLPHPRVPQRPHTSSRATSPSPRCCTPLPTPHAPPSARLAARHPPPAAPTGPPMPLDSEDPLMLQHLQVFCMYFANSNFLTPYNQLQRRPGRLK
ncbi:hypothetical protein HaLaN_16843 [Haematococcus lacustris]|uniref:Uncharacterized protein n=1 Tax=Haematococcus lacustris TaxID=44745 RepID=A0A699ZB26_HAELA|nr:hypothetical protein HaLaN_16843 [Haematococcus lacustris]